MIVTNVAIDAVVSFKSTTASIATSISTESLLQSDG